jgi:hypothetical protein
MCEFVVKLSAIILGFVATIALAYSTLGFIMIDPMEELFLDLGMMN